ncbi:MAG: aspartate aminotransferase family protein [Pseudomonadota bacterium]
MIPSILPTYTRAPMNFVKGEGSWLIEADGRRFLDLGAGIAVNALGHAAPELVEALTEQAGKLWHTSNLYGIPNQQRLADLLVEKTFADTVFFTNSGTESCELAVKMGRKYHFEKGAPDRVEIITFSGSFHGRSSAGIAATATEKMTRGFGPLLPGFHQVPFGDLDAVRAAVTAATAGILIEPVQGEGGINTPPAGFLAELRALCDAEGILLMFDEVQCGVARTGRLFAHEWEGAAPDMMMVAKGIGGGFPLGAVLATEAAASGMGAGSHGSTYGGNPLACAVGMRVIEIVSDPDFLADVSRKAGRFRQGLEGLVAAHPAVFERVKGEGLMLGLKCRVPVPEVASACLAQSLLTVGAGDETMRLLPALNIPDADIDEALARLDRAAESLTP